MAACQSGSCITPGMAPLPTHPRVTLVVDAYTGPDPFGAAPLSQWQVPSQSTAGAALDLAYNEAAWLVQAAT